MFFQQFLSLPCQARLFRQQFGSGLLFVGREQPEVVCLLSDGRQLRLPALLRQASPKARLEDGERLDDFVFLARATAADLLLDRFQSRFAMLGQEAVAVLAVAFIAPVRAFLDAKVRADLVPYTQFPGPGSLPMVLPETVVGDTE